jgi:cytochrome c oxidase assembly protein Cox11
MGTSIFQHLSMGSTLCHSIRMLTHGVSWKQIEFLNFHILEHTAEVTILVMPNFLLHNHSFAIDSLWLHLTFCACTYSHYFLIKAVQFVFRDITVQFNADVADGMPWKFIPTQREVGFRNPSANFDPFFHVFILDPPYLLQVKVKPGESALAFYTAENRSSTPITGVSTYNVAPMKVEN